MLQRSAFGQQPIIACALAAFALVPIAGARAKEKILYAFTGNNDGSEPLSAVVRDRSGNLYGTTENGGGEDEGVVFKLAPDGTLTVLHTFDSADGGNPIGRLLIDRKGNIYGTTFNGGSDGRGAVFKLEPDGTEKVLHSLCSENNCSDGAYPYDGLIIDKRKNLYGTASAGGNGGIDGPGTVFKVAPDGTETVLYAFNGGSDGGTPEAELLADAAGNLYGTASEGGVHGHGVVFEVTAQGAENVLYSFCSKSGCADGARPLGGLIADTAGNLYGTTSGGGDQASNGVVFKLAPDGTETVLHTFAGYPSDGDGPMESLAMDASGNLFGTTLQGGSAGYGTAFEVLPDGTESVLYNFQEAGDGGFPHGVTLGAKGDLFGTAAYGGSGSGVVYKLRK
ncbi:MAG TPA: choice-of-anchor tandem repeat GloVer-containing protein [Rhizomicrobium sp.]|nr:choice-of-anchor tandem repeat GloVer-containing protein [Rhizomicrobium sp.]